MPRERIAIISAQADVRHELASQFSNEFDTMLACDAAEALGLLASDTSDVSAVILDTTSSEFDGFAFMEELCRREIPLRTAVLLLVGDCEEDDLQRAFNAGVIDLIRLPLTPFVRRRVAAVVELHRSRRALRAELSGARALEEVSRGFLERMPGGLFRYRADGKEELDYVSQGLVEMFGCESADDFRALVGNSFQGIVLPEDLERVQSEIESQIAVDQTDSVTYRIRRKDGEVRWIEDRGRLVVDSKGVAWFYVSVLDITDKIRYQEELAQSNERLRILSFLNNDVIFDLDCNNHEIEVFGDFESRFGREPRAKDFVLSDRCPHPCGLGETAFKIHRHEITKQQGAHFDFEAALADDDERPVWCRHQSVILSDDTGVPYRHVGRLLDAHDMIVRERQYRKQAEHDGLTGAFNREAAVSGIKRLLEEGEGPCALALVDVDDFKLINDRFGHPVGDEVLVCLSGFLRSVAGPRDVVARFGGDEFFMFIDDAGSEERLEALVQRIGHEAFAAIEGIPASERAHLSLSVGVARAQRPGARFEDLYRRADEALYGSKRAGKNQSSFK